MRLELLLRGVLATFVCLAAAAPAGAQASPEAGPPTFSRDVAPILYARCVACHRPGEIGPMPLISYGDVRPWARAIREKVVNREMPPWHADPEYGRFANSWRLTDTEVETISRWTIAGAPQGDPAHLPPLPDFPEGWQIGEPDVVFEMPVDFEIPATGIVDYQAFVVPTGFTEDRWVRAAEVRVGDRARVHHAVVTIQQPGGNPPAAAVEVLPLPQDGRPLTDADAEEEKRRLATANGRAASAAHRLVGYAVGQQPPSYPPGLAKRVPAGASLSFSMHYTTNGTPGRDRTKVGLIFAKEPPRHEVFMGLINHAFLLIPPGEPAVKVEAEGTFAEDVQVWSFRPHMHVRGRDMTYTAIYPDGRRQILARIPRYDFNWQLEYFLEEPYRLPKGTRILVTAHFDNSPGNRHNPDAGATVRYGDQTWDEMMAGYLTYTVDSRRLAPTTTAGGQP